MIDDLRGDRVFPSLFAETPEYTGTYWYGGSIPVFCFRIGITGFRYTDAALVKSLITIKYVTTGIDSYTSSSISVTGNEMLQSVRL